MIKKDQVFHVTDIKTFKRCRRQYKLTVIDRIKPKTPNENFLLGCALHEVMWLYYTSGFHTEKENNMRVIVDSSCKLCKRELPLDLKELLVAMLENFHEEYYEKDKDIEVIHVEEEFLWNVYGTLWLTARPDLIYKKAGQVYCRDFKTVSKFPDPVIYDIDEQCTLYWKVLQANDINIDFFEFLCLVKKEPTLPIMLKNGKFSEKKIDTTKLALDRLLSTMGHNPKDYKKLYQRINERRESPFIKKYIQQRSQRELNTYPIKTTLIDMATAKHFNHTPYYNCDMCDFMDLCKVMCAGGDPSVMIRSRYDLKVEGER